jgi:hypothetical protein
MSTLVEAELKLAIAVVGGIFGVVAALVPVVDNWLRGRGVQQQAARNLEYASKKVAFWKDWLGASSVTASAEELQEVRKLAAVNLAEIARRQEVRPQEPIQAHSPPSSWIRKALLLYWPARLSAWIPRICFYAFLGYFLIATLNLCLEGAYKDILVWVLLLVIASFTTLFRHLAIRVDGLRHLGGTPQRQ